MLGKVECQARTGLITGPETALITAPDRLSDPAKRREAETSTTKGRTPSPPRHRHKNIGHLRADNQPMSKEASQGDIGR